MAVRRRRLIRGRVLAIKIGVNPNSSSLGVSTSWLLLWGGAVAVLAPALALLVRGVSRTREPQD